MSAPVPEVNVQLSALCSKVEQSIVLTDSYEASDLVEIRSLMKERGAVSNSVYGLYAVARSQGSAFHAVSSLLADNVPEIERDFLSKGEDSLYKAALHGKVPTEKFKGNSPLLVHDLNMFANTVKELKKLAPAIDSALPRVGIKKLRDEFSDLMRNYQRYHGGKMVRVQYKDIAKELLEKIETVTTMPKPVARHGEVTTLNPFMALARGGAGGK